MLFQIAHSGNVIPVLIESVIGSTTLHGTQKWRFDPNEGSRLNPDFEREHGHKSNILIEKLGLGRDGYQQERKAQQILRDSIPTENLVIPTLKRQ